MESLKLDGVVSLLNRVPALRRMIFRGPSVALCSMGGVGSTALARHIGSIADKTVREHAYSPAVYNDETQIKLGYVFGNPYNSVLSVFRRGYQSMHAKAMNANSDTPAADLKNMSIEAYLERGVDEFRLERQLDNWLNPELTRHPIILIKYEELASSIDEVLAFFDCDKPFEVRTRKSSWRDQPAAIVAGLEKMYGGFNERVNAMPAITVVEPHPVVNKEVAVSHG
ncbi:MAG: hypothetical protein GYB58_11530 [Gammaproteobacteria bacterium]|nr:hypothetical protein [Gammaproteobacteria bacterium]MDG6099267.1 hypothetical protein [Alteromonas sp. ZYF713]